MSFELGAGGGREMRDMAGSEVRVVRKVIKSNRSWHVNVPPDFWEAIGVRPRGYVFVELRGDGSISIRRVDGGAKGEGISGGAGKRARGAGAHARGFTSEQ